MAVVGLCCLFSTPYGRGQTVNAWTAGSGVDLDWTNAANWSSGAPTETQTLLFGSPVPNPGLLSTPWRVQVAESSVAESLWVRDNYALTEGDLSLEAGVIRVDRGMILKLDSELKGDTGLSIVGGGTVHLGNTSNGYTGLTSLQNGVLVIGAQGALGADESEVEIRGTSVRGEGGGQLVLASDYELGMILARDLSVQGRGAFTLSGAALVSVGNNRVTGDVRTAIGNVNSALSSANGLLTLGNVQINGVPVSTFTTFGTTNSGGVGNIAVTGQLSGTGSIEKTGAGTLILEPTDASQFSGTLRLSGGSVRISSGLALGTNFSSTTNSMLDLNGGQLEVRSDAPTIGKNLYFRSTSTSTGANRLFADHALGSAAVNGTAVFGTLFTTSATTAPARNFNSHNGYGMTFNGGLQIVAGAANLTLNNNLGGLLTFDGNMYQLNSSTARNLIIQGNGNTLITGSLLATGAGHAFTKGGSGILTVLGTESTLAGDINVTGGMLEVTDFNGLNNGAAGVIHLGSGGTTAGLTLGTAVVPTASGLETNRTINLAGTSGGARLHANQPGALPVLIHSDLTATGEGNKTLTLGGGNQADNAINGSIPNGATSGTVSVYKTGMGTWVLGGSNTYTGSTTVAGGTLKIRDTFDAGSRNVIGGGGAMVFNIASTSSLAGGTLEYLGAAGNSSSQALGVLTPSGGMGTVKVTPGAVGSAELVFSGLGTVSGNAAINFIAPANGSIQVIGQEGFNPNRFYFNGGDFAFFESGWVRAPDYGGDEFFSPENALISGQHGWLTADATMDEILLQRSLKLEGDVTLTANAPLGLNNDVANSAGNLLATGGNSRITGTGFISGSGSGKLGIRVDAATDHLIIDLSLKGITGGFNKNGDGRLTLNGQDNTILGEIQVLGGELVLGAGARLGGDDAFAFNPIRVHGATLDLGGNQAGIAALNGDGVILNHAEQAATLTVGHLNGTGTWSGRFADGNGQLNVIKTGSGAQTWTGLSTHSGSTTIGGTGLVSVYNLADIGAPSGIGAGDASNDNSNAASLVFNGSTGGLSFTGSQVAGNFTVGSSSASTNRLFTLAGTGATLSGSASNNNAIVFSNYGDIVHGVVGPQHLILTGGSIGENRLNPRLTDSGSGLDVTSVTKTGTGTWVLGNPNNAYTGLTNVENGRLALGAEGSLPAGSPLVFAAPAGATSGTAVLQMDGVFDRPISASPTPGTGSVTWSSGAGWSTSGGAGFAAHLDKLTVAIGGVGTETPLVWGEAGFMGAPGALVFNSATALGEVVWRNPIDLNGADRSFRVDDNGYTWTDFATVAGSITGTGAVIKTGSGTLRLLGANTYTGITALTAGTTILSTLGHSTDAPGTGTSAGLSGVTFDETNAIVMGNGGTGTTMLQYVGSGETSDRLIRLNSTTGQTHFHAEGSGPLILTNVANDMTAGAKTIYLRGSNNQGNMITSVLADNGGSLAINVDGGASWILSNPGNSFSGNVTVSAGALGIGADTALGSSTLVLNNGTIFAFGGDRIVGNPLSHTNNTAPGFTGDHSLEFTGTLALLAAANNPTTTSNFIVDGKTLTFADVTANAMTAARTWTINGSGHTIINGDINSTSNFALNLSYTGNGILTLRGANNTANASSGSGANTTVSNASGEAVLRLENGGKLGGGSLTLSHGLVEVLPSAEDQTLASLVLGNSASIYSELAIGTGRVVTVNGNVTYTASSAATANPNPAIISGLGTLDLGTADRTLTVGNNPATETDFVWNVSTLTGSGLVVKAGAGTLDITGVANNLFSGSWQVNAGSVLGLNALNNNIILNGGVYEGNGSFDRALGAGADQIQWLAGGNGGFAANGGALNVNLGGGAPASTLVWDGTASFVSGAGLLLFGSSTSNDVVTLTNPIDLNAGDRTVQVTSNAGSVNDKAVLSGVLSNGGLTKTGNGILELSAANEVTAITVSGGTLQFTTVSDTVGEFSNLGDANTVITLSGGGISYIGPDNTEISRPVITTTANSVLRLGSSATVNYTGPITVQGTASGNQLLLSGSGVGAGEISGGVLMSGITADLGISGGDWKFSGQPVVIGDDVFVTGTESQATLRLAGTNVLQTTIDPTGNTDPRLFLRGDSILEIEADNPLGTDLYSATNGVLRGIAVGADSLVGTATMNLNGHEVTLFRIDLGGIADGFNGLIQGPGTIVATGTSTDYSNGLRLFRGEISANLAGGAPLLKQGLGDVRLSGDNSGLTGAVNARTRLDAGTLILDYSTNTALKLNQVRGLDMRGGQLTMLGNDSASVVQNVADFTLASGGLNTLTLVSGAGGTQGVEFGISGTLVRGASAGTLRINLPELGGVVSNGTGNSALHGLLGSTTANSPAFATVRDASGTWFATRDGLGYVTGLVSDVKNDISTWGPGDHVTDSDDGFTGTLFAAEINSLRFDAAAGSELAIATGGRLRVVSGGLLITDNVTSADAGIQGGELAVNSQINELVVTHDGSQVFTIGSNITAAGITKTGNGVLHLSGKNPNAGQTQIHGGVLRVSGNQAIGDTSLVTLADDRPAMLELLADETIGRLAGGSATAGLRDLATVNVGAHVLTLNTTNGNAIYGGVFQGNGTVVKTGVNNQTLQGDSAGFTGNLVINGGLLQFNGAIGRMTQAAGISVNGGGELMIVQDQTSSIDRIGNSTAVTLNNTAGLNAAGTASRGLWLQNSNQNANRADTIGAVVLGSGHNVLQATVNAGTNASRNATMSLTQFLRDGRATALVRGNNLGAGAGSRGRIVPAVQPAGAVGGGGVAGSTNQTVIPWLIGHSTAANTSEANLALLNGNTLVTWVNATEGLRPLDVATEFVQNAAGFDALPEFGSDNVRFAENPAGPLVPGSRTINSLVLDSSTASLSVMGTEGVLSLASGALLAAGSNEILLGGFDALRSSTSDLLVYVTANDGRLTVESEVTGGAALIKSGAGTLRLANEANSYLGGTWFNQGWVEVAHPGALGAGPANFHGGGLRWVDGADFDLSSRPVIFGVGGATLDTNGFDVNFALGLGGGGAGGLTKEGAGVLTLGGAAHYQGPTRIAQGTLRLGADDAISGSELSLAGGAVLDLNGRSAQVGRVRTESSGVQILGAGSLTATEGFFFDHTGDLTVAASLSSAGGLEKTASGILQLAGPVSLGGRADVSAGTLLIADSLEASLIQIGPAAVLGGVGTIMGDVVLSGTVGNDATIDPGLPSISAGLEVLNIEGSLTLGPASLMNFFLGQTNHSAVTMETLAYVDPSAMFQFNLEAGYAPVAGSSFQVLTWNQTLGGGITDWSNNLFLPALPAGLDWITEDLATQGILRVSGAAADVLIALDPQPVAVDIGDPVVLSVVVEGSEPWVVQWVKDGGDIPGANALEYAIPATVWEDAGDYSVRVTNGLNVVESAAAAVVVRTVPIISMPPQDATVVASFNHLFQVAVAGPGPLAFIWKKDGEPVPGAPNSPDYLITGVTQEDHQGVYTVEIINDFGSVESDPATLTVSNAVEITVQPNSQSVPEGNVAIFSVVADGGGDLTYQWFRGGTQLTDDVNFSGTTTASLQVLVSAATLGNYRVVVTGFNSQDTSQTAQLTFGPATIGIVDQPDSLIVPVGGDFQLQVGTTGGRPQTFQWRNGNAIAGGANVSGNGTETLAVTGATLANGGAYTCRVTNNLLSGSSSAVTDAAQVVVVDQAARRVPLRIGSSTVLTANATGPVTGYQWFWDNGTGAQAVAGATARTYRLPTTLTAGRHIFFCRVSGFAGDLNAGENAVLVFDSAPEIAETGALPATILGANYQHQVKMATLPGQAGVEDATKTATKFTARGLPRGLTINNEGLIQGRAQVAGDFKVTLTATNGIGGASVVADLDLKVEDLHPNLIGDFAGPVDPNPDLNGNLGGMITATVTNTAACTLRLTMGTLTYTAKGPLEINPSDPDNPVTVFEVKRGRLTPLTLTLVLNGATGTIDYAASTITAPDAAGEAKFTGWLNSWVRQRSATNKTPAASVAGLYTLGLNIRDGDVAEIPQGTGHAAFTVNAATAKLTVVGRTQDNTAFTTATHVGPNGQVLIFRTLYGATARGSVRGSLTINPQTDVDNPDDNTLTGAIDWWKPADPSPKQRVYPNGFREMLTAVGARYLPVPNGVAVLGIDTSVVLPGSNAVVELLEANVNDAAKALPLVAGPNPELGRIEVLVNGANKVVVPGVPAVDNPRKVSVVINRNTGLVTIKFTLSQANPITGARPSPINRVVTATAQIVTDGVGAQAVGYFLLPQLPTQQGEAVNATPILSGQALFFKKP